MLTLGSFTTYLSWKISGLLSAALSAVAGGLVESVTLFQAYSVVDTLREFPLLVGFGGLVFSALCAGSLWVLYRNLIATPPVDESYARLRV
jgi:hypothetical protein